MANLQQILLEADQEVSEASADVLAKEAAADKKQRRKDRTFIAWIVISVYAALVAATAVIGLYSYPMPVCEAESCDAAVGHWLEMVDFYLQLLSVGVLPIVTLVIGYYFGTEQAAADNGRS